jgi:two-component system, OmpR family, KDP operon response regulator KdpE
VTKPFAMAELLARLRAVLRRDEAEVGRDQPRQSTVGRWLVDLTAHQVRRASAGEVETLRLTPTEWQILELLLNRPGQLVGSAQILTYVWGPGFQQRTNYLRFHMARLRRKLEENPARPAICSPNPAWDTAINRKPLIRRTVSAEPTGRVSGDAPGCLAGRGPGFMLVAR